MQALTKEQGIVLTGYTGLLMCNFSDFHEDVEARLKRPVFTHEFGDIELLQELKSIYKSDFLSLIPK